MSIELAALWGGVCFILGHCCRNKWYCPAGKQNRKGFVCDYKAQRELRAVLKPDAKFDGPAGAR